MLICLWRRFGLSVSTAAASAPKSTEEDEESGGGYTVSDVVVDGKATGKKRTAWFVKKNIKGSTKKMNHLARQVALHTLHSCFLSL